MSLFNQSYNQQPGCFGFCKDDGESSTDDSTMSNMRKPLSAEDQWRDEAKQKKQEVDDLLSEGMSALTFEERQQNQEILHGVAETAEDEEVLNNALDELDLHLLLTKEGSTYEIAEQMDWDYVNDRSFRVMFLRANQYNPKESANQMLRFFESKSKLFGSEKLVKDITLDDLDDEDKKSLNSGMVQVIGDDRSGRPVLMYVGSLVGRTSKNIESEMRAQFFIVMKLLQSQQAQLRGTISIWYTIGDWRPQSPDGRDYVEFHLATMALPQKKAAIHLCLDDSRTAALVHGIIKIMKGAMRARIRMHYGSPIECQYQLSTYGISSNLLPVDSNGKMNLERHRRWVQSGTTEAAFGYSDSPTQEVDGSIKSSSTVSTMDVLFTGGRVSYSEGNQLYLGLVQQYAEAYDTASLQSKRKVVDEIISKVTESGGRFLRRQAGSTTDWEDVALTDLRKKITQTFRNRRRRPPSAPKQNSNQQKSDSAMIIQEEVSSNAFPLTSNGSDVQPNQNDVMFTGTKNSNHIGNQRFLSLVQDNCQDYDCGTDESKRGIVNSIIGEIHEAGGRFLKQDDKSSGGRWKEVPEDERRKKIMQAFRNRRRRRDAQGPKQNDSETIGRLIVGEPNPNDVIFGITRTKRNAGSELLHHLINENLDNYEALNRGEKGRLVEVVMQVIVDRGGRFLQQSSTEPGRWVEVAYSGARDKISKYFRNFRRQRLTK